MTASDRRAWLTCGGLAVTLALVLGGHPLVTGRAYSQADILFDYYPWAAHRPAGMARAGNTLLGDVPTTFYPFLDHTRRTLRDGRLPAWNPYIFGGHPLIGSTQGAVFSPLTAIAYVVALPGALTWIVLARLLVGGVGMCLLLQTVGLGPAARALGMVGWLLNAFTWVWLEHPIGEVSAWLPWLVWGTWRTCTRRRALDAAGLAVVTALAQFSGHPETAFKALLLCGSLAVVMAARPEDRAAPTLRQRLRGMGCAGFGVLLGVAMAAVQVLPSLEYIGASRMMAAREAAEANVYIVPPETLVTTVVPNFFGHPAAGTYLPMENRYGLPSNYAEQQAYAGITVWLLAAVGAWHGRRDTMTRAVVAAAAVAALLMYGAPGLTEVAARLPGLDVAVLSRFGMLVVFSATWLAALGCEALVTTPRTARLGPALMAAAAMAGLLAVSLTYFHDTLVGAAQWLSTLKWAAWAASLTLASLVVIAMRRAERVGGQTFAAAAVALVAADLAVFGWGFHPTVDRSLVFPRLPEIERASNDPGVFRVVGWRGALAPNAGMVYRLADIRGYDGIAPRAWSELLDTAMPSRLHHEFSDERAYPLLDLLNVRYVFAEPDTKLDPDHFTRLDAGPAPLWRNDRALPRAFLVSRVVVADSRTRALELLREGALDLRHVAVVDAAPEEALDAGPDGQNAPGTAAVTLYRDDAVEVATRAPGARLLVLSDAYYPGWVATVDGRAAPLLRANHALRGVVVPAGEHVVRFTFRPTSLLAGAWMSLGALVVLLALVIFGRRQTGP